MKIMSSSVALASTHEASRSQETSTHLRFQDNRGSRGGTPATQTQAQVAISAQARAQLQQASSQSTDSTASGNTQGASSVRQSDGGDNLPASLRILKDIVEAMTGRKIHFFSAEAVSASETASVQASTSTSTTPANTGVGWSFEFSSHSVVEEAESTQFAAAGNVTLADGSTLAFKLDLSMQRTQHTESNTTIRAGDPPPSKDPLVLNLSGAAVTASGASIAFDLSGNGGSEHLPVLQGGGYLVLDRNGNGKVDNGSELFGPQSGDGFADLAALDTDKNGWIDEGDAAFSQLKLWQPTADGKGSLTSLKDQGVGALFLGKTSTPFTLKDASGQTQAAVRTSGVYLNENGSAGALQQIDVVA